MKYVLDGNGGVWRRYADGRAELAWDGNPVEVMGLLARLDATRAAVDALKAERDKLNAALDELQREKGFTGGTWQELYALRAQRDGLLAACEAEEAYQIVIAQGWRGKPIDDMAQRASELRRAALRDKEAHDA